MADDILSQEEVDALLRGVTGEPEEAPVEESTGGIRPYDIGRQERIVRGRMPTLELIHERFARLFRIGLFNFMRRTAEISINPIKVQKYSDFVRNLVVPTNLNVVHALPLRGTGLIIIEPTLVFQVVDHLFGGSGQFHTRIEGRDFTATEQRVIGRLLDVVFEEFRKAWEPVYPLRFEFVRSEMNTQFANICTPTEVVVAASFTVDLGSGSGDLFVCLPYSMLEPIRDVIYSSFQADRAEADLRWVKLMTRQVQGAEVDLVADLATAKLTLRELTELEIGDVISLSVPELVTATVDGIPVAECKYGIANGNYALKVQRVLAGGADEQGDGHG
ncbi:MAG: flagellar motor switch protein FliM [Betaproteobacteria bacterium]|nr:flagellar motor switch protein FliM [Betaproteobacteria bacterium]